MASLETPVCDFGWKAIDFDLPGVDGKRYNLSSIKGENGLLKPSQGTFRERGVGKQRIVQLNIAVGFLKQDREKRLALITPGR